jgi:hypothetical protein
MPFTDNKQRFPWACSVAAFSVTWNGVVAILGERQKAIVPDWKKFARTRPRRFGPVVKS